MMESRTNWFYSLPPGFGMIITAYKQYSRLPGGLQGRTRVSMKTYCWQSGRWPRPAPSVVALSRVVKWTLEIGICLW